MSDGFFFFYEMREIVSEMEDFHVVPERELFNLSHNRYFRSHLIFINKNLTKKLFNCSKIKINKGANICR